jgi:hypothetical protein
MWRDLGVAASLVSQLTRRVSAMRRLSFLLLLMIALFQTAGIRDGASHCAKILSVFYDSLDTSDPNDPEVIIKIDISNAFNTTCRALTLDVLSGRASRDYARGLKRGDAINTSECLIYLAISKPCAHATLSYDTLTGTDRFT